MKRRLNILCLLVFLVFCYSVFNMGRDFGHGFSEGMKISHSGNQSVEQAINFRIATLMPKDFSSFKDSVYNEKTGSYVPVAYTQMVTNVKVDRSTWMMVAQVISGLLAVFAIIASTVLFIQLIVAINKSDIFNWKNVRRLRWLGVALLLNFISEAVPALMNDYELSSVFSLSGYGDKHRFCDAGHSGTGFTNCRRGIRHRVEDERRTRSYYLNPNIEKLIELWL